MSALLWMKAWAEFLGLFLPFSSCRAFSRAFKQSRLLVKMLLTEKEPWGCGCLVDKTHMQRPARAHTRAFGFLSKGQVTICTRMQERLVTRGYLLWRRMRISFWERILSFPPHKKKKKKAAYSCMCNCASPTSWSSSSRNTCKTGRRAFPRSQSEYSKLHQQQWVAALGARGGLVNNKDRHTHQDTH